MFETVDRLERRLVESSLTMSTAAATMLPIIRDLDRALVALIDGSRSMTEWLAARLDIEVATARQLTVPSAANRNKPACRRVGDRTGVGHPLG